MTVTGPWSDEARAAFEAASADTLVLNYALGFDMGDIEFVRGLPVRRLTIIDRRLPSLEPIYDLAPTLEFLHLEVDTTLVVDLERLPQLTDLACDWKQVKKSFAAAAGLRQLYVGRYAESTLGPLTVASSLRSIVMKDRPAVQSLEGLDGFSDIQQLEIYRASKLADVSALRTARHLKELQLETCKKVATLDAVATCVDLTLLNLSEGADFPSAEPLRALTNLQELYLYGSTRIVDGDLGPIAALPRLHEFRMRSRKEYHPGVEEIQENIASRA